ncbi:17211_t:CDS:2 [Funneliformis caledonium]|uniref:17211_t:CDS:1 n=1 Tax=Funneliformis caledonium TaxID=1117310 RepID=A0A9N9DX75_9GLOM|nr:17211_t:CDS:2 [Funneliformis caledonium]
MNNYNGKANESPPKWHKIAAKVAVATRLEQSLHPRDSPPKWQSQSTLSFSTFRVPAAKVAVAKYSFFTLEFTARLHLKIITLKCLNDE